jgi:uncharacterized protein
MEFNLLCIPTTSSDPDVSPELHAAAHQLCVRSRAIYLADPAPSWSAASDPVSAVIDGLQQIFSEGENAAMYFPRVNVAIDASGTIEAGFAPSGAIAGAFVRFDEERGVWRAPADSILNNIASLSSSLSKEKREALKTAGVNALVKFPSRPIMIWGGRTLAGAAVSQSDWKFLSVRRLALMIETSLERGLVWTVFEQNDERLWQKVRDTVESFMFGLWRQGAFQGRGADEGFFVRCDRSTMSQDDLDNGRLVCQIGFAPLKPAEFVIIRIVAKTDV